MGITKEKFGTTKDGKDINAFVITNSKGMSAKVIEYGAILTELFVPDKNGKCDDVVLGYDTLEPYYENGSFFGATVGRSANRIKDAKFTIDGVEYKLSVNDGPNNLHTHMDNGMHKKVWESKVDETENAVTFFLSEEDGENGFPGKLDMAVTYAVTEDNEIKISYVGASDKKTLINMTNHSYFNLSGHDAGTIVNDKLWLKASCYTPVVAGAIPTGEIAPVEGTVFDFTKDRVIAANIDDDVEQLKLVQGYDHNFVIDKDSKGIELVAKVTDDASGRVMEVYSDLPGIQFYAGNCISDTVGKNGVKYTKRTGLCLETQFYPDSINQENFIKPVFDAGEEYNTTTIYKFI